MKYDIPTSTVAYSVYQAICKDGPAEFSELRPRLHTWIQESRIHVSDYQLRQAVEGLIRRGWARNVLYSGVFDVNDPQRRFLISRERGGDGWKGWKVQPIRRELQQGLEIAEVATECNT